MRGNVRKMYFKLRTFIHDEFFDDISPVVFNLINYKF